MSSKISGIELNTSKTEILIIGDEHAETEYIIVDKDGQDVPIKSIETIKVCGIHYSYNEEAVYKPFMGVLETFFHWYLSKIRYNVCRVLKYVMKSTTEKKKKLV